VAQRLQAALEDIRPVPVGGGSAASLFRRAPTIASEVVATLDDEDALVVLLHTVMDWQDAFTIARLLLARFGSFPEVISAQRRALQSVPGVPDRVIALFQAITSASVRLASGDIKETCVLQNKKALYKYLHTKFARKQHEECHVLFLNVKNVLIEDWLHSVGTTNGVSFYIRDILRHALEISASALIVVHNHPSGDATPSELDIEQTRRLCGASADLGLVVHDHVIVANGEITSMRELGFIA
jgi:DNA repair protein RadC